MFKKIFSGLSVLLLAACTTPTHMSDSDAKFEETRSGGSGLLVGSVVENFLTQPHGLYVLFFNENTGKREAALSTYDRGLMSQPNDILEANRVGKYFALEIPEGKYSIKEWGYRFFEGQSTRKEVYPTYNVESGKATYVGRIHADALPMLMRVEGDSKKSDLVEIKNKYNLNGIDIIDGCSSLGLEWWQHTDTDLENRIVKSYLEKYPSATCQ